MVKYHFQCGVGSEDPAAKQAQVQLADEIRAVVRAVRSAHDGQEGLMKDAFDDRRFDLFLRQGEGNFEMGTKSFERAVQVLDEISVRREKAVAAHDLAEFNKLLCVCLIGSGNKANAEIINDSLGLIVADGPDTSPFDLILRQNLTGGAVLSDVSKVKRHTENALSRMQSDLDQLTAL